MDELSVNLMTGLYAKARARMRMQCFIDELPTTMEQKSGIIKQKKDSEDESSEVCSCKNCVFLFFIY